MTILTLKRLAESATSDVQEAACGGMIDLLSESIDETTTEPSEDEPIPRRAEPEGPTYAALASYVESSRGTAAASAAAEALVYENEVVKALIALSWEDPTIKVVRNVGHDGGPDAVVELDGRRVLVETKAPRSEEHLRPMVFQSLNRLQSHASAGDGVLVITPFPSPLSPGQEFKLQAIVTQWRIGDDKSALLDAIRRASRST
ncbi:hypothetical protein [Agromyces sp. NPDC058126]|uniref:hypothetical protein n=1 Tax=Agromyces sp. NPDC058126 TaxID=3346350 RepID=UPI0036DDFCBC